MNKKVCGIIAICIGVIVIIVFIWQLDISSWKKLDIEKIENMRLSTRIYDSDGNEAARAGGSIDRVYVKLDELPAYVYNAFVAAEDVRFYDHNGIDTRRIFGALWNNIKSASYSQGASTITQQLIKLTHLTSEKTIARKAQEAWLAIKLEKQWTKDQILEAYINTVYFGGGAYGIGAASHRYFSKDAHELTVSEAALLAGIIKSPTNYAPHNDMDAALNRRDYVIDSMEKNRLISSENADLAKNEEIVISEFDTVTDLAWYTDEAISEACDILDISTEELMGGGYSIYTGLDVQMQMAADEVMSDGSFYPEDSAQGALIALDTTSGEIRAITGGREYSNQMGLNRAVSSRRQPGSLIKPISTYAVAVEKYGYMPASTLYDVQREYADDYMPGNSGGNYYDAVTMRFALSKSLNAATVDLADTVGIDAIQSTLSGFGIPVDEADNNLALALGAMTYGATPAEMCAAYAALANSGVYNAPHCIRSITDRHGKVVYEYEASPEISVSADTAYVITDMLKTAATEGTAKALASVGIPVAAKTGTSGLENGDTSDAWAAAYTPDIAVTVWIGKDSNSNGGMAKSVTGGGYAAPACAEFINKIKSELSGRDFMMPDTITRLLIDGYALNNESRVLLADAQTPREYTVTELFDKGTEIPVSDIWEAPLPVSDLQIVSNGERSPVLKFTGTCDYAEYLILRSCRGNTEIIAVIDCPKGDIAVYEDTNADISQINSYTVIPRHRILYESGISVTGSESAAVQYAPDGILNGITSIFENTEENQEIESIGKPIF